MFGLPSGALSKSPPDAVPKKSDDAPTITPLIANVVGFCKDLGIG